MNKEIKMEYPKGAGSLYFDGKVHTIIPDILYGMSINNKNLYIMDYRDETSGTNMSTILANINGTSNVPLKIYGQDFEDFKNIMIQNGIKIDNPNFPEYIKTIEPVDLRDFLTDYYTKVEEISAPPQEYNVDVYYDETSNKFYCDQAGTREIFWNNGIGLFYYDKGFVNPVVGNLDLNSLKVKTKIIYNPVKIQRKEVDYSNQKLIRIFFNKSDFKYYEDMSATKEIVGAPESLGTITGNTIQGDNNTTYEIIEIYVPK